MKRNISSDSVPQIQTQNYKPAEAIKVLLLEKIHANAELSFKRTKFEVIRINKALSEDELIEVLEREQIQLIGIRSKTKITAKVLQCKHNLWAIACFCIGTNQVDLEVAANKGIPVFNSPFCNSRSVAELMISEIIALSRKIAELSSLIHKGIWHKSSIGSNEVRGKTLGIVGYGHIGTQLSILGEALGMRVLFYDIVIKLPLGNSTPVGSLDELLEQSDYVCLHVPDTPETKRMIGKEQIAKMKKGSYLLNASRGTVVILEDLAEALKSGHLAGAAVDVYPLEPKISRDDSFSTVLQGCPNTILTPHIGGSTEEAQAAIGLEVADKLTNYVTAGNTKTSVNFPQIGISYCGNNTHRILSIHKNQPGVLKQINAILGEYNIASQTIRTRGSTGYLIVDVESEGNISAEAQEQLEANDWNIICRVLY